MNTPHVPMDDAHLQKYAANAAREAKTGRAVSCRALAKGVRANLKTVCRAREELNLWSAGQSALPGAAEWLLDNHYLARRVGVDAAAALRRGKCVRRSVDESVVQVCARGAVWAAPELDQSVEKDAKRIIRPGEQVIVSARGLFDGKVLT